MAGEPPKLAPKNRRPKLPWATLLISLAVVVFYLVLSGGFLYISNEPMLSRAFSLGNGPTSLLSHMFVHVGVRHLVGNLVPLLLFGAFLELAIPSWHALLLFFVSGATASLLYALLTPAAPPLVGASAAVSGLMGAALSARPRQALLLLILTPLLLFFAAFPLLQFYSDFHSGQLAQQQSALSSKVDALVQQQKLEEAAAANASLRAVSNQAASEEQGKRREEETPTALSVHVFGALVGVAFLFLADRKALDEGAREFRKMGDELHSFYRMK